MSWRAPLRPVAAGSSGLVASGNGFPSWVSHARLRCRSAVGDTNPDQDVAPVAGSTTRPLPGPDAPVPAPVGTSRPCRRRPVLVAPGSTSRLPPGPEFSVSSTLRRFAAPPSMRRLGCFRGTSATRGPPDRAGVDMGQSSFSWAGITFSARKPGSGLHLFMTSRLLCISLLGDLLLWFAA